MDDPLRGSLVLAIAMALDHEDEMTGDDTPKDEDADEDLLGAILKVEDDWKIEAALEGLGRLLPRRVRRITVDQHMANDFLRGDVAEVRRRGKSHG